MDLGGSCFGKSRSLVLGLVFKENVRDLRNSKAVDMIAALRALGHSVDTDHAFYAQAGHVHEFEARSASCIDDDFSGKIEGQGQAAIRINKRGLYKFINEVNERLVRRITDRVIGEYLNVFL